jgi:hypoxanthine phosphoribosyltransferase
VSSTTQAIQLGDKKFVPYITEERIQQSIESLAARMSKDLNGKNPLFLVVLNGAFLFAADLVRHLRFDCELSFVKLASYEGTASTGTVKELIGLNEKIEGRTVVVIEDIVDTGHTIQNLWEQLQVRKPAEIFIATMLFKPEAYKKNIPVQYAGLEIPEAFIVGYGLDYNGLGRNLRDIYVIQQ